MGRWEDRVGEKPAEEFIFVNGKLGTGEPFSPIVLSFALVESDNLTN